MATYRRERHLFWPVMLIGLGLILLMQNFGIIDWTLWEIVGRFWPVILILIGADLLFARSSPLAAGAITAAAILGLIAAGLYGAFDHDSGRSPSTRTNHVEQALTSEQRAEVRIQFGAGGLSIGPLPDDSRNLVEADADPDSSRGIVKSYRCDAGDCVLRLSESDGGRWMFGHSGAQSWSVRLTPRIPLDARIESGASQLDLDLNALRLNALRLDVGASTGTMRLPAPSGTLPVTIKAGAADLTVAVPAEVAARIRVNGALSNIQVDETRFAHDGGYYTSSGYATATDRIDLNIDAGVSSVRIQ